MPAPALDTVFIDGGDGWPQRLVYLQYPGDGGSANRDKRVRRLSARLSNGTWSCAWCGDDLPIHLRTDAIYCREGCRKAAARQRRKRRLGVTSDALL